MSRSRADILADLERAERIHMAAFNTWTKAPPDSPELARLTLDVANAAQARRMFLDELEALSTLEAMGYV